MGARNNYSKHEDLRNAGIPVKVENSGGKMMAIFPSMGRYSKWGSWGIMEYHGQPTSDAPKYQAVIKFFDKNPKWW